jgi:hypothetical protein
MLNQKQKLEDEILCDFQVYCKSIYIKNKCNKITNNVIIQFLNINTNSKFGLYGNND